METMEAIHAVLWLGLLFAFVVTTAIILWRVFNKRPIKRWVGAAVTLIVLWACLSPAYSWWWRRHMMEQLFGQTFSPKPVYSLLASRGFSGDGTDVYVFSIPEARISSITNIAAFQAMDLPRLEADKKDRWHTIHWTNAPFLNDTNDIQLLVYSGGADPKYGVSGDQLKQLMNLPSTLFACAYKTSSRGTESGPQDAYAANFYILVPDKRQLIMIFSSL